MKARNECRRVQTNSTWIASAENLQENDYSIPQGIKLCLGFIVVLVNVHEGGNLGRDWIDLALWPVVP